MIISGRNAITELLRGGKKVEKVLSLRPLDRELVDLTTERKVPVEIIDDDQMQRLTKSKKTQGMVAFVPEFKYNSLEELLTNEEPFLVILDGIQDPHNLGAIIRTCECAGVDGIIVPKNRACPVNETVYSASAGAIANVKIAMVTNLNETIRQLKDKNIWIYALEADGQDIYSTDLKGGLALVVGSEGFGVHELTRKTCDGVLSLPMYGKINSLNASNASAIAVYEAVRQRRK